jgi:hypothetical protein
VRQAQAGGTNITDAFACFFTASAQVLNIGTCLEHCAALLVCLQHFVPYSIICWYGKNLPLVIPEPLTWLLFTSMLII